MTKQELFGAIEQLNGDNLIILAGKIQREDTSYLQSYEALAEFFAATRFEQPNDFVCAAHLVYAWMPKVLNLNFEAGEEDLIQPALVALKAAAGDAPLAEDQLLAIAAPFNGSLVAPSKMLHFRNPDLYAIWDSRVVKGLLSLRQAGILQKPHHQLMQRLDLFLAYQEKMRMLVREEPVRSMEVLGLAGATAMRRAEYCLFLAGRGRNES